MALPFINIAITFQSRWQIRPILESNTIIASLPAKIKTVCLKENQTVQKGEILLVLNTDKLEEQITLNQSKLSETTRFITDLKELTKNQSRSKLNTLLYQKEIQGYQEKLQGLKTKQNHYHQELKTSTGTI